MALLALAQLGWHAQAARYWAGYLDVFRREVATRHGLVPFDQSVLSRPEVGGRPLAAMNWGWTMPLMSVLLAPGGNVRSIVENPQRDHWQPFPPGDPDSLPDLSRVGIRFDAYRAALGER